MSFDSWQNDPARLRQLLRQEWQRTGKLRAEHRKLVATLQDCAKLVASLKDARAPHRVERGDLLLNVCDYYNLDDLGSKLNFHLASLV